MEVATPVGKEFLPVFWSSRFALTVLCCAVLMCAACAQQDKARPVPPGAVDTGTSAALQAARDRVSLEEPGSQSFHMEVEFESTSDTGAVSRGTFTEDWWHALWWRHVTA